MTQYWPLALLLPVLLVAAVTDLRSGRIYNALTYPAAALGLVGHALLGGWGGSDIDVGLLASLLGLAAGFVPMMFACFAGGINGGDVKLMGAVGAILGAQFMLAVFVYTLFAAALLAILVILRRRVFLQTFKRIGLFIWQILSMHKPLDPAAPDSPKIPFGLAICLGVVVAVAQSFVCTRSCAIVPGLF